jgi:3-hydroxyacyl-[acyl-carrier-protein] dehydratase
VAANLSFDEVIERQGRPPDWAYLDASRRANSCRMNRSGIYSHFFLNWTLVREIGRERNEHMRFNLVDRITEWQAGKSLKGIKFLTLAEEYLADHFPGFPVMPGVLMLEAVVEASAWLWRINSNFEHSVIVMRDAKNVKYGSFMQPGNTMEVGVELVKQEGGLATFRGKGNILGGAQTVSGQVTLAAYNIRDTNPALAALDEKLIAHWRERFAWLSAKAAAGSK